MKIKSMMKYSLSFIMKGYLIYIAIVFLIINIAAIIAANISGGESNGSFGGMDFATIIFMFVVGIANYHEDLSMATQNGISRKTFFCSVVIVFSILSIVGSLGDTIISMIGNFYQNHIDGLGFDSNYEQMFMVTDRNNSISSADYVFPTPGVLDYLKGFILQFSFNIAAISAGLLIASINKCLPKVLKFIIPVVFYSVIFIVAPILDFVLLNGSISKKVAILLNWMLKSNWNVTFFFIGVAALLLAIAYMFIRRVKINDRK